MIQAVALFIFALSVVLTTPSVAAVRPFTAAHIVNEDARLDNDSPGENADYEPFLVASGPGSWLAIWQTESNVGPGDSMDVDVVTAASADGGTSWTSPAVLLDDQTNDDQRIEYPLAAAASAGGTVIVVLDIIGGAVVRDLAIVRSLDGGATWAPPHYLGLDAHPTFGDADLATDDEGVWTVVFAHNDDSSTEYDIFSIASADDGATWGVVERVFAGSATLEGSPRIVTDAAGTWMVAWRVTNERSLRSAVSTDNGASWSAPVTVANGGDVFLDYLDLATDRLGKWTVSMADRFEVYEVRLSSSSDNGATWSTPVGLGVRGSAPAIVADGSGTWMAAFLSFDTSSPPHNDWDLLVTRSTDGGVTWTPPYPINGDIQRGAGNNFLPQLAEDGAGGWMVLWASEDTLGGTKGEDLDILSAWTKNSCPSDPSMGCASPMEPRRSRVTLTDRPPGRSDRYSWSFGRGESTLFDDLGDPLTGTSYALCLYDYTAGTPALVHELDAVGGEMCGNVACWRTEAGGYRYDDPKRVQSGLTFLSLKSGADGEVQMEARASGLSLGSPLLPLNLNDRAEMHLINRENGHCWAATFSTATRNIAKRLKALSD